MFDGWHLIGMFPEGEYADVGSWILHHHGEAALLEVPPGLTGEHVNLALRQLGSPVLKFVTASHEHEDHLDEDAWDALTRAFPTARFLHPSSLKGERLLDLGGEPLWLLKASKHSASDVVTVFRGVAMTGDIELGMLASVNKEVPWQTKMRSMDRLRSFQERAGYHVHTIVSAHVNDVRTNVNWPDLFSCEDAKRRQCRSYGCWGKLVPMKRDSVGRDMKCEVCGCPDWSDPRKK